MIRRRAALALALLGASVAGCAGGASPLGNLAAAPELRAGGTGVCAGQTPPPVPSPSPSTSPAARGRIIAKLPLHGLIDLGQVSVVDMAEPPYNTLFYVCKAHGAISGIVVNDTWANLQPTDDAALNTKPIDDALAEIAAYDKGNAHPLGVRLRIWAGIDAPDWAKAIGGPINVCVQNAVPSPSPSPSPLLGLAPQTSTPTPCPSVAIRTYGAFWSQAYENKWAALQQALAQKYDGNLEVSEVSVSSCSSLSTEPFVQAEDSYSKAAMLAAHYTDDKYLYCLKHAVANDYAPYWHLTGIPYSFNPFREIQPSPPRSNLAATFKIIDGCRQALGPRCVLLNETLAKYTPPPSPAPGATPSVAQTYYQMWAYMSAQGGRITFQSASPPVLYNAWGGNLVGWNAAVADAKRYHASSIELFAPDRYQNPCGVKPVWYNGYTCFAQTVLDRWARMVP